MIWWKQCQKKKKKSRTGGLNCSKKFTFNSYHYFQEDLKYPHPLIQDLLWGFLHHFVEPVLKRWPFSKLRDNALRTAMEHVHYEDENSRYLCIGSTEKVTFVLRYMHLCL